MLFGSPGHFYLCVCVSSPCACSNDTFTIPLLRTAEVVVYIAGGATYEEARTVGEMNAANPGVKITLAGTTMHNAETFQAELLKLSGAPAAMTLYRYRRHL